MAITLKDGTEVTVGSTISMHGHEYKVLALSEIYHREEFVNTVVVQNLKRNEIATYSEYELQSSRIKMVEV